MFMLMGIVKKIGIMIVDFARQRGGSRRTPGKAIHDASMDRFRPYHHDDPPRRSLARSPSRWASVLIAASRRPLGLVIVGGLVVSQFITLYITLGDLPVLEEFQEKVLDRTSFFRSGHSRLPSGAAAPFAAAVRSTDDDIA